MKQVIGGVEFAIKQEYGRQRLEFLGTSLDWKEVAQLVSFLDHKLPKEEPAKRHKDSFPKFGKEALPVDEPQIVETKFKSKKS
jgi:hypothetical protein